MSGLAESACSPRLLPRLCDASVYSRHPTSAATEADTACWAANTISSRLGPGTDCWLCTFSEATATAATTIATQLPGWLICGFEGCSSPLDVLRSPGPILSVLLLVCLLASAIGIARAQLARRPPTDEYLLLMRTGIAIVIAAAIATGYAETLWTATAHLYNILAEASANTVRTLAETPASQCQSNAQTPPEIIRDAMLRYASAAADLAAALTAVAVNLLPSLDPVRFSISSLMNYFSIPVTAPLSFFKIFIAFAIAGTGLATLTTYLLAVAEAALHAAIAIGASPVIAFLALFRPTRNSVMAAASAVAYGGLMLLTAGISITLSSIIVATGLDFYTNLILVEDPLPEATARIEACHAAYAGPTLPEAFRRYLCIYAAHQDDLPVTSVNTDITDLTWMPATFVLILAGYIARAIAQFGCAIAAELSAYSNASGAAAQTLMGVGRQAGSWATSRITRMFRR